MRVTIPYTAGLVIISPFPASFLYVRQTNEYGNFIAVDMGKLFTNQQMPRTPFILPLFAQTLSSYSGEFREI